MESLFAFGAAIFGAIIGSFLNVVIHRYPREESIVFPPSRCGSCGAAIKPYDNVPVLSFIWLRGRCRACGERFSMRYPLVELANALFYFAIFQRTGISLTFIPVAALVSMFIVLIYIDADIQILPDVITIPGTVIGLVIAFAGLGRLAPDLFLAATWQQSVAGAIAGAGVLTLIIAIYWLVRRVEGMGWGDVKMMAMIGATIGLTGLPAVLLAASVAGSLVGIPLAMRHDRGMQVALPFGVFLGLATLGVLFFGHTLWEWYLALLIR